jgi:hypothetical protein
MAISTARTIAPVSAPHKMLLPHSTVSGLSVTSRKVTFGTPKIAHSSCTVPLSVKTGQRVFFQFYKIEKSERFEQFDAFGIRFETELGKLRRRARVNADEHFLSRIVPATAAKPSSIFFRRA